jgi:protein TonB
MPNTNILKGVFTLFTAFAVSTITFTGCMDNNRDESDNPINSSAENMKKDKERDAAVAAPEKKTVRKGRTSVDMSSSKMEKGSVVKIERDKDGVYKRPETMPAFPGGEDALAEYMEDNIDYEQEAIDNNTAGTIQVSFVVDENGKVRDARVISSKVGGGLDEQAVTAVEAMPAWTPGTVKGKKVKTRLTLPVSFQIEQ